MEMEQNLNSEKTPARASQGATGDKIGSTTLTGEDDQKRLDEVAMKAAKRAENRFREDEGKVPGSTPFTK
jgi:hypothetical protein